MQCYHSIYLYIIDPYLSKGMTRKKTQTESLNHPLRPLTSPYRAPQSVMPLTSRPREHLVVKDVEKGVGVVGAVDVAEDVVVVRQVSGGYTSAHPFEYRSKNN